MDPGLRQDDVLLNERIVFLDLETTGGSFELDRIIEIGLVEVDRGKRVGEWSTLVNPGRHIPQGVQTLTGITDESVAEATRFEDVSAMLYERLQDKVLAAHNARFDYTFLKTAFRRTGVQYVAPVLCTVKLSRRLFPQHTRHNLDALIMRHAIFCLDRHRALGDARVLAELAEIWRRDLGAESLTRACDELLRAPALPPALAPDLYSTLPEAPGVYFFYGENEALLHVGRNTNLRARVMAHFGSESPSRADRELTAAVRRVDWTETAGELGAHVREARSKRSAATTGEAPQAFSWHRRSDSPHAALELVNAGEAEGADIASLYGVFRSRAGALRALRELGKAYGLCNVTLGIEKPGEDGACAAYAQGHCRGACAGREPRLAHAMRTVQALSRLRLKPWPYPGAITVRETSPDGARTELHVIDRWRYLGTAYSDAEVYDLAHAAPLPSFDLDMYRLLVRFLKTPPPRVEIAEADIMTRSHYAYSRKRT